tara:strand:- start:46 stop:1092 length:1047 start_codon:yes stop_codon:yes gene_type:complete
MAYSTVNKHTDFFNTKLYTGTGSSNAISGVGFKPDLVWTKARSEARGHNLNDIVRGPSKWIGSNDTATEQTVAQGLTSFDSDGFTVGTGNDINKNTITFASWNWLAGGNQGSSNTDGSINTTYTSVNTTAKFSITTWTGTGSNATVGHGLGVAPKMIIFKRLDSADDWTVYHVRLGETTKIDLNGTATSSTVSSVFNDTAPTSSVFSVGTNGRTNASGGNYVAYCFTDVDGYSKCGKYTGNNSSSGPFIYTGFKPSFIMIKRYDATGDWRIYDTKRFSAGGPNNKLHYLRPNNATTEGSTDSGGNWDMLSNGFRFYTSESEINGGGDYIYYAVGQTVVGSNNVAATAR